LARYQANLKLFKNEHYEVFKHTLERLDKIKPLQLDDSLIHYALGWPRRISTHWMDMLFSEPPAVNTAANAQELEQILKRSRFYGETGPQSVLDRSVYGDAVLRVGLAKGEGFIQCISPRYWFPIIADGEASAHVFAWPVSASLESLFGLVDAKRNFIHFEIHIPGEVIHRVFRYTKNKNDTGVLGEEVSLLEIDEELGARLGDEQTDTFEADDFLVIPMHGLRLSEDYFGLDDYEHIAGILNGLESRFAHIDSILDRHSDPKMAGPPQHKKWNAKKQQFELDHRGHYFDLDAEDRMLEYITWEAELEYAFTQVEKFLELLYLFSETSPAAFGQLKQGLAESGSALKRLMISDEHRVARERRAVQDAFSRAIELVGQLTGKPLETSWHWFDGVPSDPLIEAQAESTKITANLTDYISAIMRANNVSRTRAEQMWAELIEQKAQLAAFEPAQALEQFGREGE
jgi:hypothetical protein